MAGTLDSYLIWRFTGGEAFITDTSTASRTMMMDLKKGQWDQELLDIYDIPRSILPEITNSSQIYGYTTPETFFGARVPVAACITDVYKRQIKHITVLTNSIFVLNELIDTDVRLFVLGGCVNSSEYDMEGHLPVEALKHFCVDVAFICAGGITKENGVSDYNCEVAQVNKAILSRARKTVLVAHAKKFGLDSFSVTCPLDSIHTIVSDSTLSKEYVQYLLEKGIELILADV